jgi:hypothetical protein
MIEECILIGYPARDCRGLTFVLLSGAHLPKTWHFGDLRNGGDYGHPFFGVIAGTLPEREPARLSDASAVEDSRKLGTFITRGCQCLLLSVLPAL